jgi:hypothetical protein
LHDTCRGVSSERPRSNARLKKSVTAEEARVGPEHKGRGYEVAKGQYILMDEAELEAIEIESTHIIEIDCFVPRSQIDQRFFDTPYYVAPNGAGRAGGLCGHSRGYARQGHGGARAARALVVSLTYVRVPRSMPLARAVADYQKH